MVMLLFLISLLGPVAQTTTPPPISGQWINGDADSLQIKLEGQSLTIVTGRAAESATYKLDGSASRNVSLTAAGERWNHESQARWVGNAILIVTRTTRSTGQSWEWLRIFTLDSEAGDLRTVTVDQSHERGDGMITRITTYRRAKLR
jgi:hypothetical protein